MNCREALEPIRDMPRIADVRLSIGATHDLIAQGGAVFSPCERYRYLLWRIWNPALPFWSFGMLNPSTADHMKLDPTITRCHKRAQSGGAGGLIVWNLFAYRATDPKDMKAAADPVGPENDQAIKLGIEAAVLNVAGWGSHGDHRVREHSVRAMLGRDQVQLHALAFTATGLPRHPLYLSFDLQPQPWKFWD